MKRTLRTVLVFGWIPTLAIVFSVRWLGSVPAEAQGPTSIKVTRMYTGGDNQTHAEEIEIPLSRPGQSSTAVSEPVDVSSVLFRRTSNDYYIDFHNAPRRQYVITLAGESEVEFGDGTKVRLYPGHILLAEDLEGQGHISRAVGSEDRISIFLPLAE